MPGSGAESVGGVAPGRPDPEVAERLRRWNRTLDSREMWPDTTRDQRVASYASIFDAARRILAGDSAALAGDSPDQVRAMGVASFVSGVGPLLGWWIEQGSLQASPPVAQLFATHLDHGRRRAVLMRDRLGRLLSALNARGITPVVLKGAYTSERYFPDPGTRPSADIDLLVGPHEFEPARSVMRQCGLQSVARHALPVSEDWGPATKPDVHSAEMSHADNPWSVDLHQTLDRKYFRGLVAGFGTPRADELVDWVGPAGRARILAQPLLTAHLAVHASAAYPNLHLLRAIELVFVIREDGAHGHLRWDKLLDRLRESGAVRFAYPAFALANEVAPGTVDGAFLRALEAAATPRMRRTLRDALRVPPYHFARASLQMHLAWSLGPRQTFNRLLDWLYPSAPDITPSARVRIFVRSLGRVLRGQVGWRHED